MTIIMKKPLLSAAVLLLAAALCVVSLASDFRAMQEREPIYPGPGVTSVRMLSDWFPGIYGTPGDTEVYILEGNPLCHHPHQSDRLYLHRPAGSRSDAVYD